MKTAGIILITLNILAYFSLLISSGSFSFSGNFLSDLAYLVGYNFFLIVGIILYIKGKRRERKRELEKWANENNVDNS